MDYLVTIKTLYNQGQSQREMSRNLNISRNTVKKYVEIYQKEGDDGLTKTKIKKESVAEAYKDTILKWLEKEHTLTSLRIWEKLVEEMDYKYRYDSVRRYVGKLRSTTKIVPRFDNAVAGKEAQVDFGYVGLLFDRFSRKKRKAYVFCMRLIYSKYDYYEVVFGQEVKTFLACHENAFRHFGGIPESVKIDNLKAGVLEANFYNPVYQGEYFEFSKFYGFEPNPCRARKPKEKAHVENGIKFVKYNFFAGRTFEDIDDCSNRLKKWNTEKAQRIHGATNKKPIELFEKEEKTKLKRIPIELYDLSDWSKRKVQIDCYVRVIDSYYSVPSSYIGEEVNVKTTNNFVEIYDINLRKIYTHSRTKNKGMRIKEDSHFPEWVNLVTGGHYKYCIARASKYGDIIRNYCEEVFIENKINAYRMVHGILSFVKTYGRQQVENACLRAASYENYTYICIKNILTKNLINDNSLLDLEDFRLQKNTETYSADLKAYDAVYSGGTNVVRS